MPTRFERLWLMDEFASRLSQMLRNEPSFARTVSDKLDKYHQDCGALDRKKVVKSRQNVWRTKAGKGKRIIDKPLGPERASECAILYVDEHERALEFGEGYDRDTLGEIAAGRAFERMSAGVRSVQDAVEPAKPDVGMKYASVLGEKELLRVGLTLSQARSVRARLVDDGLAGLDLANAVMEKVENLRFQRTVGAPVSRPVPGYEAPRAIGVSRSQLATLLKQPLHQYLAVMTDEQQELARRQSVKLHVIKGAAGTGKTVIGVRRVEHLLRAQRDLGDDRPVLFACFNQVLRSAVEQMIETTLGVPIKTLNVEVRTVHELLTAVSHELRVPPVGKKRSSQQLSSLLEAARASVPEASALASWSADDILAEIRDVVFGRAIERREEYRVADRTGRGRGMPARARDALWSVYEDFRRRCDQEGVTLWEHVAARVARYLERNPLRTPRYYGVVVDEVQDLTPAAVRAIVALQAGDTDRMLLLGDAAQNVYHSSFRWIHVGINVPGGQATVLRKCFRSTPPIARAANSLMCDMQEELEGDLILPEVAFDPDPPLVSLTRRTNQAELLEALATLVVERTHDGVSPSSIGVLIDRQADRQEFAGYLEDWGCRYEELYKPGGGKGIDIMTSSVKLLTTYSAKGLEFPVLFIPLVTESRFPCRGLTASASNASRRDLFTAMLRCGWELHLGTLEGDESGLIAAMDPTVIQMRS